MSKILNHGFVEPQITDDWTLELGGSGRFPLINTSGNWFQYLPKKEIQHKDGFDTNACYIYGSLNMMETLMKFHFGGDYNFSERWQAYLVKHKRNGGDPHRALESIRKKGVIGEGLLPFDVSSYEDYVNVKPTLKMGMEANRFFYTYSIQHDWLILPNYTDKETKLLKGLQESPIGVSVRAWRKDGEFYVKDKGQPDTHWCLLFGMNPDMSYNIYDTYDSTIKRLAPNYDFQYAKRMTISLKKQSWFGKLINKIV
jgi:hypothetical protein